MAEAATIARPYARAAFEFARDSKVLAAWSEALRTAAALSEDARVAELLSSPNVSVNQIVGFFDGLGAAAGDRHWQNFVRLLATNKRIRLLPQICIAYEDQKAAYENEVDVEVSSAVALSDDERRRLAESLKKRLRRNVRITTAIDPSLLGGAVIRAGDLVIDGSVKGRLKRLATDLAH
jgi:F-type H+-transporting ATPase subunit delta